MEAMKYHRLSRYKIRKIILCFTEAITASSASKILPINRNTTKAYYNEIREKILQHSLREREKELANLSWTKVALKHAGFVVKGGEVQPAINGCKH